SGILDLTFRDKDGGLVLVELQLEALNRYHFYKVMDYRDDLIERGESSVRVILLCNFINETGLNYIKRYRRRWKKLSVKPIKEEKVRKIILEIDPDAFDEPEDLKNDEDDRSYGNVFLDLLLEQSREQNNSHAAEIDNFVSVLVGVFAPEFKDLFQNPDDNFRFKLAKQYLKHIERTSTNEWDIAECEFCKRYDGEDYYERTYTRAQLLKHISSPNCRLSLHMFEAFRPLIQRKENEERVIKEAELVRRKLNEPTYFVDPTISPLLIDEDLPFWNKGPRDKKKLDFAEHRLIRWLKFKVLQKDQITLFSRQCGEFLVFADIRSKSKILFRVFKMRIQDKLLTCKPVRRTEIGSFEITDTTKQSDCELVFSQKLAQLTPQGRDKD
ncbi:hypothetical protein N9T38_02420, partial [SAR116 cluster bacterium]|nr:hypothetical protein [SAR116 cluster bacterium]